MADVQAQDTNHQPQQLDNDREIAFYAAALNAFYTTSLEYDKSLFTLSAGGVGLLVTLLTTVGITSAWELAGYLTGISCFVVSLSLLLVIFKKNKDHIVRVVSRTDDIHDKTLKRLDVAAQWAFGLGAMCTAIVGILAAIYSYEHPKGTEMTENKKPTSSPTWTGDSAEGIRNLRPDVMKDPLQKSFTGVERLRPQASNGAAPTGTQPTATQSVRPASSPAPATANSTPTSAGTPVPKGK
ncbi:hypothetical protein X976_1921 [Burkholderia pseudomallei MSHR7500]|uniref:hypothetical protein n=1 Tax=Burkholderia pseudomallei TaxID=28450 RepID=UPI000531F335|nr:hypothetical protein [Burkholderia pseudomallei]KGS74745.1 hypothetical protein X976_1921 [Burkholderia pseudomallei MSHR7500]